MIPDILKNRICKSAVDCGHLNGDGGMPRCYRECSCYFQCTQGELEAMIEIDKLSRSPVGRRVLKEMGK